MQRHKHLPAIKLVNPATAKRDAGHGAADSDAIKNDLKCSIYCHNTDYDCGNLKLFTERTEISLMPQESWEALDCSEADEEGQSAGEAQEPVSIVVQDWQIRTRSQKKAQTGM